MKKAVSIFLTAILLLNVMGYYGLFLGLRYENSLRIIQRLDADNYNSEETITLKVPLSIPYYGNTDFERVDGEIEHKGEFYRLVKQKFEKDTLYIVCIKDVKSRQIKQALTKYVKTFSDQPSDQSNTKTVHTFIKDYIATTFSLGNSSTGWSLSIVHHTAEARIFSPYFLIISPPPEA